MGPRSGGVIRPPEVGPRIDDHPRPSVGAEQVEVVQVARPSRCALWVAGIDSEPAYAELSLQAIEGELNGIHVRVCGLDHLIAMNRMMSRSPRRVSSRKLAPASKSSSRVGSYGNSFAEKSPSPR